MSKPRLLQCPACGSSLTGKDLDPDRGLAKCGHCSALMALGEGPTGFRERPSMPLPSGMRLSRRGDGLEIVRRWFTPAALFLVFFCVAWDGFLFFWYSMAFRPGTPWLMKIFPLAHVAVGVVLTYSTLAALLNTTRITLDFRSIQVIHGPIPWRGNRVVPREAVDQLYSVRKVRNSKNGPSFTYEVWMKSKDGSADRLVGGGLSEEQAITIEREIERALGIPDRAVAGELER